MGFFATLSILPLCHGSPALNFCDTSQTTQWKRRNSWSSAVLKAKFDYLPLCLLDNALMRVSRTKCMSTFNGHEERYSKCYSTFDTRKYRKSTSSTSFHSCGPESSPSQVPSKCALHPSVVATVSLTHAEQKHPKSIQLCIAIVKYKTKLKHARNGLCTTWLAGLEPSMDRKFRVGIHRGLLSLPPTPETPVVCIGPGTGIAPMRCMIQERIVDGAHSVFLYMSPIAAES